MTDFAVINDFLLEVQKPARYIGSEFNSVHKHLTPDMIHFAVCFPDAYEIGMSHLGLKIIYDILNRQDDVFCERCFTPWTDMEQQLRRRGIPLFGLESKTPLSEFDIIGFSLQYELGYTNVLNMLNLANIPLSSRERLRHPLVIAGGPCCYNPEPLSEFIDVFFLGEAEDMLLEFTALYRTFKNNTAALEKNDDAAYAKEKENFLRQAAGIEGLYLPRFYEYRQAGGKGFCRIPLFPEAAAKIKRRFLDSLENNDYATSPPVPFIEVVHDRINLEIMRGCPNRCLFCQAGFTMNPVRVRSVEKVRRMAEKTWRATGYDTLSFCALSSASYPYLKELIMSLHAFCAERGLGISLPSLRIDKEFLGIISMLGELKKTGLTFAPEAGSLRLRKVINKNIDVGELKEAVLEAYRAGWRRLKLYFMIGLPTETEEDLLCMINLIEEFSSLRKAIDGRRGKVSIGISNYIPKPHTPFQWLGMDDMSSLSAKQEFLRRRLSGKYLDVDFHNVRMSYVEAYLSRADRSAAAVIKKAFENGARFDAWTDKFNFNIWMDAFRQAEIAPDYFVHKHHDFQACLPWEHIDCGVRRQALQESCVKSGV
ncbi:MAG: TIGR03960 family B12-binding radical SAM protein [Candidatus Omnitrophica bacterium]|nr:TIGR03960 family B12-binding radical SAM protein [Candidatus Omnitrophota bacterium]